MITALCCRSEGLCANRGVVWLFHSLAVVFLSAPWLTRTIICWMILISLYHTPKTTCCEMHLLLLVVVVSFCVSLRLSVWFTPTGWWVIFFWPARLSNEQAENPHPWEFSIGLGGFNTVTSQNQVLDMLDLVCVEWRHISMSSQAKGHACMP